MALPPKTGLYDPDFEHDACGLGFVATLNRRASREVVSQALQILANLTHRGAAGCDPCTGDGAGILLQLPHAYFAAECAELGVRLPAPLDYGVANCFLSPNPARRRQQEAIVEASVLHHRQELLGWRDVPVDSAALGPLARDSMPALRQLFIGRREVEPAAFERALYVIRNRCTRLDPSDDCYIASCSSKTIVYKGLMLAEQLAPFYRDLNDPRVVSRLAMVHSRFSTNTFPSWERAHPFRLICHNGEINTLNGNRSWMRARETMLASEHFSDIEDLRPIIRPGGSDSAALDNVVEFLLASGRSLPHVMMMLIPEAFAENAHLPAELRAFYEYHACLIEPWDGPAVVCFSDGERIGAILDRNGLRPGKFVVTHDGLVVLASEFGVLDIAPARITEKGRLQPGKIFLVDTTEGRVIPDAEVKAQVATRRPFRVWIDENRIDIAQLPKAKAVPSIGGDELTRLQQAFGYTDEDLNRVLGPMALASEEPVGSMGVDIPLAVLSAKSQVLFRYFKQLFAQVTNPPVDPIREQVVMSLLSSVGGEGNLLEETPQQCRMVQLPHPILTNQRLATLRDNAPSDFRVRTLSTLYAPPQPNQAPGEALRLALARLRAEARQAVEDGSAIVILSDRGVGPDQVAIPSLLAVSAVHHDLIRAGQRMRTGLIVESGEPREVHHLALLIGYGAGAVNPYLAFDSVVQVAASHPRPLAPEEACEHYVKALKKGLLKTMSKMGISTVASYQGAQIFEAIGIDQVVIDEFFTGTASRIRGIGLEEIARESLIRHESAFSPLAAPLLEPGGHIHYRVDGEPHLWSPEAVGNLQKAVRLDDKESYRAYARLINDQRQSPMTLRGLWDFSPAGPAVPLEEVEPADQIVRRFATGAMSFGSLSKEAHENLAVAMNRIGGKSNTGEGGEDPARYVPEPNGDSRRSAIKQVASARFGVTTEYLMAADELQIKMAQGAKPGEGGQLPGSKVDEAIARVRHSVPGVTLISPPPHHDIYSIEDLAQLIFDLKNVNPRARVSVKLVSEAGVGTVAAGVAKAHADVILISGHDGGTGASPLTSIHHAGTPWELGLAETQQVLLLNKLRSRVRVQVDGQLKTGRDVVFAALLGAEEFGFATAPLVASGCIMMRKCHLNTCPVGVATQDPDLRKRFPGKPEHVIRFMYFIAEEVRELMASLGFRTVDEMVGRVDCIVARPRRDRWKLRRLDFSEVLYRPRGAEPRRCVEAQQHNLSAVKDLKLIEEAREAIESGKPVQLFANIRNSDRAFGSMLSGEIVRQRHQPLADDAITVRASGSAGQSFGAFAARGLTLVLEGDANDYVGKGLSGGILAIYPPRGAGFLPHEQVIVGNTVLYGATSGRAFFSGRAGERFAVRNSGAVAVVEGLGDHGCEYMTGGRVVILGSVGRNFAAGMSGGVAYVLDPEQRFAKLCNTEMVALEEMEQLELEAVRALIEEHRERTGSPKAAELLRDWRSASADFVKVIPSEYKRVLLEASTPATSGQLSVIELPVAEPREVERLRKVANG